MPFKSNYSREEDLEKIHHLAVIVLSWACWHDQGLCLLLIASGVLWLICPRPDPATPSRLARQLLSLDSSLPQSAHTVPTQALLSNLGEGKESQGGEDNISWRKRSTGTRASLRCTFSSAPCSPSLFLCFSHITGLETPCSPGSRLSLCPGHLSAACCSHKPILTRNLNGFVGGL